MSPADGIIKFGFRRWYERQLIEGHAYLTTCFLCMIVVMACMELFSFKKPGLQLLLPLLGILGGGALCLYSWVRYKDIMVRAEHYADHSICGQCQTYAKFSVTPHASNQSEARSRHDPVDAAPLHVRCRKCGYEWKLM